MQDNCIGEGEAVSALPQEARIQETILRTGGNGTEIEFRKET